MERERLEVLQSLLKEYEESLESESNDKWKRCDWTDIDALDKTSRRVDRVLEYINWRLKKLDAEVQTRD